jgi:hypothetical protein
MPKSGILFAFVAMVSCAGWAYAQESLGARLMMDRLGDIQTGAFTAGDSVRFTLSRYAEKYLMRFDGDPEIYVLYADHGSLGGRVLRYDSGGTALAVSGWGAMTIYTDVTPAGLPAERSGDCTTPVLPQVSLAAVQAAADDEGQHLAYVHGIHMSFAADWAQLAADAGLRMMTFDAMQNAARGIDRFAANARARAALIAKMDAVEILTGGRPTIALRGRTLQVTFVPGRGFAGRASSHGIARALGQMLSIPTPG